MASVTQEWVHKLSLRQQSVLLVSLRGCDGMPKNDPSKAVVRIIRAVVLVDAKPPTRFPKPNDFITYNINDIVDTVSYYYEDLDRYPVHFFMHVLHALEIIGYKHPDENVRTRFLHAYILGVHALHLNPETEAQLDDRLS